MKYCTTRKTQKEAFEWIKARSTKRGQYKVVKDYRAGVWDIYKDE